MKEYTTPPCEVCGGHDKLEREMNIATKMNAKKHENIMHSLDKLAGDVQWMKILSRWLLTTMIGYFIALGVYIFSWDFATQDDLSDIRKDVKEGEALHYRNERMIHDILGKVNILVKEVVGGKE